MIDEIQVKDVALIREASLSPSPGLTVLTGETGAGKTALVSAVKLLVGERADSSYVREGAKNAEVRGRLFPSDPAADGDRDKNVGDRIGRTNRRQGLFPDEFSYHHRIGDVVKLLKQVSEDHRKHEKQECLSRTIRQHVIFFSCHSYILYSVMMDASASFALENRVSTTAYSSIE